MIDASTEHMVDSTRPSQTSWKPSDLLANYERLLGLYTNQLQKNEPFPRQVESAANRPHEGGRLLVS
jgi:hypothetical protein